MTKPQKIEGGKKEIRVGDIVKVIGGNYDVGCPSMEGKRGLVTSFGTKYKVKGKETVEVFVDIDNHGQHVFNDYHLTKNL